MDARQFPQWGTFLARIGWTIERINKRQVFIRKIPFLPFSVIKIQRPKNPLLFAKIDQLAKKYHALCTVIEPEISGYNEEVFLKNNYQKALTMSLTHTATIKLDLKMSKEKIWASFSENARRNIKKAKNNQLQIKRIDLKNCSDDQDFALFYQLLKSLNQMKKFYIPGFDEFHKKMLSFKDSSVLFFAYHQKEPVACLWVGYFNQTAVYMHLGINQKGYDLLASYLLAWEAIQYVKKIGMMIFDFEGTFDPRFPNLRKKWQGFSEFKSRFHGQEVFYPPPWIKIYNPVFKLFYLCSKILSR